MSVQLNHTIVSARDPAASAAFLIEVLGRDRPPVLFGPFTGVELDNGAILDFIHDDAKIEPQHYAFLVSEGEFDQIFRRIKERNLTYWADPAKQKEGEIYHHFGGRGVYWCDPDGHFLEIMTRPYVAKV